jgi:hypothetical protein
MHVHVYHFMSYALFYVLCTWYWLLFELYVLCLWTTICNIMWVELCLVQITLCRRFGPVRSVSQPVNLLMRAPAQMG